MDVRESILKSACETDLPLFKGAHMNQPFDHAANDSPRSGSSKRMTPVVWGVIVVVIVAVAIWFAFRP
jgi:hypothetical protein